MTITKELRDAARSIRAGHVPQSMMDADLMDRAAAALDWTSIDNALPGKDEVVFVIRDCTMVDPAKNNLTGREVGLAYWKDFYGEKTWCFSGKRWTGYFGVLPDKMTDIWGRITHWRRIELPEVI